MHKEIKESGLGAMLKISTVTDDLYRAQFLGKEVEFKQELWVEEEHGELLRDYTYIIKEVQNNYKGDPMLRGYLYRNKETGIIETWDDFGRILDPKNLRILS